MTTHALAGGRILRTNIKGRKLNAAYTQMPQKRIGVFSGLVNWWISGLARLGGNYLNNQLLAIIIPIEHVAKIRAVVKNSDIITVILPMISSPKPLKKLYGNLLI